MKRLGTLPLLTLLSTALAIAPAAPVVAAENATWYLIDVKPDLAAFISDDIQRDNDMIMKVRVTFIAPKDKVFEDAPGEDAPGIERGEVEALVDCAGKRVGIRSATALGQDGRVIESLPLAEPLAPPKADKGSQKVYDFVCGPIANRPTVRATNKNLVEVGRKAMADYKTE